MVNGTSLVTSYDDEAEKMMLGDGEKGLETDKTDKTDKTVIKDETDDKELAKDKHIQRLQSENNNKSNERNVVGVVKTSSQSGSLLLTAITTS
jgi:hypothetical protein